MLQNSAMLYIFTKLNMFLRLAADFFLAAAFAAAFLFRVRAAFLADARRLAVDVAMVLMALATV